MEERSFVKTRIREINEVAQTEKRKQRFIESMPELFEKHATLQEIFPELDFNRILFHYGRSLTTPDALGTFILENLDKMPIRKGVRSQPKANSSPPEFDAKGKQTTESDSLDEMEVESEEENEEFEGHMTECPVCLEQVPILRMISCEVSELTEMEEWNLLIEQSNSSTAIKPMPRSNGVPEKDQVKGPLVKKETVGNVTDELRKEPFTKRRVPQQPCLKLPRPLIVAYKGFRTATKALVKNNSKRKEEESKQQTSEIAKQEEANEKEIEFPRIEKQETPGEEEEIGREVVQLYPQYHSFCRACVRGHAQAAITETPLAQGGLGLKCMVGGCKNILRNADIRRVIPKEVRQKLGDRIFEENLGIAHISNLERCRKCNYAVEMLVPAVVDKVFNCVNCKAQTCRLCDHDWDAEHFGLSCDMLQRKIDQRDKRNREMERRLNEAVVRKCPGCGLNFVKENAGVKEAGCNKMTCRCGMKMCYICRKTGIDYDHFCQHPRDPTKKDQKCEQCDKPCLLWQDFRKTDELELEKIRTEAEQPCSSKARY